MTELFTIKALQKGVWRYFTGWEKGREWDEDLYVAKHFKTYSETETFLNNAVAERHWGGYFQIEKYFISK